MLSTAMLTTCCQAFRIAGALLAFFVFTSFALDSQHVEGKYKPIRRLWNETWTDWLKRDLLLKYDKFARPAQHYNNTRVTIDVDVRHVTLDELKSIMTVHAWVKMAWIDEKLKWNASDYGGLSHLHLGDHEVWQPDIVLYNNAAGSTIDHYGNTHCIAYEDGTIIWVPPSQFLVFCDLNLRLWPFDTQTCSLKLGSWMFNGDQIDLQFAGRIDQPDLIIKNSEWKILEMTRARNVAYYPCCSEPYIYVTYNLTLKRDSPLYYTVVVTPAATIVILILITFWLPPQSEEKITIGGCTVLIIIIFLLYFSHKVPALASNTPLILCFYSGSLYQVTISLILSALVINMSRKPYCKPLPWRIKQFLLGWPGKYLGLYDLIQLVQSQNATSGQELCESHIGDAAISNPSTNSFDNSDRQIMIPPPKTTQLEWILAATAIDRIAFVFYCLVLSIMAITCLP